MPTLGERMLADCADAESTLDALAQKGYEPGQIRNVLSTLGAKTEIFLKSVVLTAENPRNNFFWFINKLENHGIAQLDRDNLHELRKKYNDAKHDPATHIGLLTAVQIVKDARQAIGNVVATGLGAVGALISPHLSRVFWVAAWDHYIHGDTEVHVILPGESEHWLGPPTFDIIYVKLPAWDSVKKDLSEVGVLKSGRGIIPDEQYQAFNTDSDFLEAIVFEGNYRTLITTLATYELRQDLLPGLNRHETSGSMINAFLLAAVDVVSAGAKRSDLSTVIQQQATQVYAVPADFRHAEYLADGMTEMFLQIAPSDWKNIVGPSWIRQETYSQHESNCRAKHAKYQILIDNEFVTRMLWSHR